MVSKREIENQKVMIETLKSEMIVGYQDVNPENWTVKNGYIPTCEYDNRTGAGTWTEGIKFQVLDEDNIAFHLTGDYRDDEDWQIGDIDSFVNAVITDAEEWLERWQEERQDHYIQDATF